MRLLILALVLVLTGCPDQVRPDPPPTIVEVERKVYVPIPEEYTRPCPIAKGPLSEMPRVARERRTALEGCNADKAAIQKIQGTPVPPTQ